MNPATSALARLRQRIARLAVLGTGATLAMSGFAGETQTPTTFCNPVNLSYRFSLQAPSRREAADPVIMRWNNEYWLFASKSGGYWHSADFIHWTFVAPTGLPLENYAPATEVIGGKLYFTAGGANGLFTTTDPVQGQWTKAATILNYSDPALFADSNGRVYMYSGTSATDPIKGVELNASTFTEIGSQQALISADPLHHGWELKKLDATDSEIAAGTGAPFIEGAWMTKHAGTYYLQYAAPGTEKKWYGDGVYTSGSPLGPFTYQSYSPFSQRSTGFIGGTGHGNTFQAADGNYWHSTCGLIGTPWRSGFERRLMVFPAGFVPNGSSPDALVCNTYLGDYPQYPPGQINNPLQNNLRGWMLLNYNKTATASSSLSSTPPNQSQAVNYTPDLAFDEDIRTWWSAATGNAGEWLSVDMGKICEIRAIQTNFADMDSTTLGYLNDAYRYLIEVSNDGQTWTTCLDRSTNTRDAAHDYAELDAPVQARYVRLTNVHTPAPMKFSVSGFRIFGNGLVQAPPRVTEINAQRMPDRRRATVNWKTVAGADFYIIRYGITPDLMYQNAQVYGQNTFEIDGLNTASDYYFTVDAINDSGITQGTQIVQAMNNSVLSIQGWTASASTSSSTDVPQNALDGNTGTRWGTGTKQAPGQWFQIDMGILNTVYQITQLNTSGDYPRGYEVYLSLDGTNWGTALASGTSTVSNFSINLKPQTARYIRMVQTGSTTGNWWSIIEAGVTGNPARALPRTGWKVSASSSDTNSPVANAIDASLSTRWSTGSSQANGQWFQIDFGDRQRFNQIVLDATGSNGDYPRGYEVRVSNDGVAWSDPLTTGVGTGPITTIAFALQTARYARITQTGSYGLWWSIHDLNVYGPQQDWNPSTWTASASVSAPNNPASQSIDGNINSGWTTGSAQAPGQWFQVDMGTPHYFNQIALDAGSSTNDYPRGYQVYVSADGINWGNPVAGGMGSSAITTITFPFQTGRYVRIVQTGSTSGAFWSIYELSVNDLGAPSPSPLPSPWQTADLGSVGVAGSASYDGTSVFTVAGSGSDIQGTADAFRYVYQTASGDCTIVANVTSQQNTNSWAKAGVMIRETTTAGAANVAVLASNGAVNFQWRSTTGGSTSSAAGGWTTPTQWVKLARIGNSFSAFRSSDGVNWIAIGTPQTIAMASSPLMGLAVTSHNNPVTSTVTFDSVTATP